jgi:hypothetical protein
MVGDGGSLSAFYRPEDRQERGQKGICLTTMVDLQCAGFRVEGELGAKMAKGRGGDGACILEEEGRGCGSVEGRQVSNMAAWL